MPDSPTLAEYDDRAGHSRACGITPHPHGPLCAPDCPTCRDGAPVPAEQVVPRDKRLVTLEALVAAEREARRADAALNRARRDQEAAAENLKDARAAHKDAMTGTPL